MRRLLFHPQPILTATSFTVLTLILLAVGISACRPTRRFPRISSLPTIPPAALATDVLPVTPAAVEPAATTAAPAATAANLPVTGQGSIGKNPSSSSPIAISDDDSILVVANTLDGSVSVFNVARDANTKVAEIQTGTRPRTVAISPDKRFAYVANEGSGTVSVVDLVSLAKAADIPVGVGPYGVALTPDGKRGYVANAASGTVSILDLPDRKVTATIPIPGVQPRGVAVTNNNGGQGLQYIYITQFLSQPTASGKPGADRGSEGKVFVISTANDKQVQGVITLSAHNSGFSADRTKFGGTATDPTFAYPNQLQNIVLKNGRAYLPNIAASPEGPIRFDVDTQAFISVFDMAANAELSGGTINLQTAVKTQTGTPKVFLANPWGIAFKHKTGEGYVVSAASDVLAKIKLDASGIPSVVTLPAENNINRVLEIPVGKNPRGVVVNNADTRAYVANYISKDVSVIDLTKSPESLLMRIQSHDPPEPGSDAEKILSGEYLFNSSRGTFDEGVSGRMSNNAWQACASCHPDGLSDGVIWQFASGPRKSLPLNATFSHPNPEWNQRILNYSALFDEVEDFEGNIRGVSGGQGLIVKPGTTDPDPTINAFDPPNHDRPQLHVNGVNAWDTIVAWLQLSVASPVSPYSGVDPSSDLGKKIARGRQLFIQANCQACHGGPKWATAQVEFARVSPFPEPVTTGTDPEPPLGQLARFLKAVGTFNPNDPLERTANNQSALGKLGFNPPSLLGIWAFPPYLHNGACPTLQCVLDNATHRNAGGSRVLDNPSDRDAVVQFLISIDANTEPINP